MTSLPNCMTQIPKNYTSHIRVDFYLALAVLPHTAHLRFFTPLRYRSRRISFCVKVLEVSGVPGVDPFGVTEGAGEDAAGGVLVPAAPSTSMILFCYKCTPLLSSSPACSLLFSSLLFLVSLIETLQSGGTLFSLNSGAADALLQCWGRRRIPGHRPRPLLVSTGYSTYG